MAPRSNELIAGKLPDAILFRLVPQISSNTVGYGNSSSTARSALKDFAKVHRIVVVREQRSITLLAILTL